MHRNFMGLFLVAAILFPGYGEAANPVHVLVWDERQPRQSEAYDNFLGNEIAARLQADDDRFSVRSVALDDPEQGLSEDNLAWADVVIWWGHARQAEVSDDAARKILERIRNGRLDLIALHSAHWAKPFVFAMNERSVHDSQAELKDLAGDATISIDTVSPPRPYTVPIHGSTRTPNWYGYKKSRSEWHATIHLPYCCFPDYRPDAAPSRLTTLKPDHPIAAGLPKSFHVPHTEMYNEPFHVPDPDEIIFEERWELGEHFRSGMIWNIGKGKVFYFRPGHETYAVYQEPAMIQVLQNACAWLGMSNE